jgi:hypothetical protein
MRKVIIGMLLTLMAVSVFASQSRVSVLNMGGYISDIMSCWTNPGYLVIHHTELGKDAVGFEFGFDNAPNNADNNRWGYLHYGVPNERYFAIAVNRPFNQDLLPFRQQGFDPGAFHHQNFALDTLQAPHNMVDVMYSTMMGKAGIGINLNFGMWGTKQEFGDTTDDLSSMSFGILGGYYSKGLDFTLGAGYLTGSAEYTDTMLTEKLDVTGLMANVGIRYKIHPNQNTCIILPIVGINYMSGNGKFEQTGTGSITYNPEWKGTRLNFTIGSGIVWFGDTWKAGIAGELGYMTEKSEGENEDANNTMTTMTTNTITFPRFRAGAESRVWSWLTARAGMTYQLAKISDKTEFEVAGVSVDTDNTYDFYRNMNVQVGLGIHFGPNFTIDTEVSEDLLYNGPYLLSGANNGTNPMNIQVSATYTF